ncbi:MAG TPA: hypothetical protein VMR62_23755 [Bryobacteraceae bacterium]|jgi:hypothetical protein|nr:hypothetical protein [Bryobacteraceae bacterium]
MRAELLLTQKFEIEGAYQLANQQMVAAAAVLIGGYPRIPLRLSFIPPLRHDPREFVFLCVRRAGARGSPLMAISLQYGEIRRSSAPDKFGCLVLFYRTRGS